MISPTRLELLANIAFYIEQATLLSSEFVIRGKQNSPVPLNGNYCTLIYVTNSLIGTSNIDITENTSDDTLLNYSISGRRDYIFSIQFYRNGATDLAKELMMFHETPQGQEFLETALFTFKDIVQLDENSTVMSRNYEERAILNFEIIVSEYQTLTINKVSGLELDFTYNGDSDIQETIEVDVTNG